MKLNSFSVVAVASRMALTRDPMEGVCRWTTSDRREGSVIPSREAEGLRQKFRVRLRVTRD